MIDPILVPVKVDSSQLESDIRAMGRRVSSGEIKAAIKYTSDISSATKTVQGFLNRGWDLHSKLVLDTTSAVKALSTFKERGTKVETQLFVNTSAAVRELASFRSNNASLNISVTAKELQVSTDTTKAAQSLDRLFKVHGELTIKPVVELGKAAADLKQLRTGNSNLTVDVSANVTKAANQILGFRNTAKTITVAVALDSADALTRLAKLKASAKDVVGTLGIDTTRAATSLQALEGRFKVFEMRVVLELAPLKAALGALFREYKKLDTTVSVDVAGAGKGIASLFEKYDRLEVAVTANLKTVQTELADFRARFRQLAVGLIIEGDKAEKQIRALFGRFNFLHSVSKVDTTAARQTLEKLFKDFGKLVTKVSADTDGAVGSLTATHQKYKTLRLDVTADPKKLEDRLEALSGRASSLKIKADLDVAAAQSKIAGIEARTNKINASVVLDDLQARAKVERLGQATEAIRVKVDVDTDVARAKIAKLNAQTDRQKLMIETELKRPNLEFMTGLGRLAADLFNSGFQIVANLIQGALAGIGGFLKESVKVGNEVDSIVRRGSGLAGGGEETYRKIRENAIQVGAQPNFLVSTKDVAQATEIYLKAGKTLDVAIASQEGVAALSTMTGEKASNIAGNMLDFQSKFQLTAKEQARASELFAGLLTSAKLNSKDVAMSAKYLTPDGNTIKDLENNTKQLALMAASGIRGSTAATSMGAAMRNLPKIMEEIGVTRTDEKGIVKSSLQLMLETRKALLAYQSKNGEIATKDLVLNAKEGFGVNGGRAMLQFMQQSDELISSTLGKIDNAATKMKVLSEESMKSSAVGGVAVENSLEALQVRVAGSMAPALNAVQISLSNILNGLTNSPIWKQVDGLTASITKSINSPAVQVAFGKVGEWLSLGILSAVSTLDRFFKLLANPPKLDWLTGIGNGLVDIFVGLQSYVTQFITSLQGAGFLGAVSTVFEQAGAVFRVFGEEAGKVFASVFSTQGGKELFTGLGDLTKGLAAVAIPLIRAVGLGLQIIAPSLGTIFGLVGKTASLVGTVGQVLGPILDWTIKGLDLFIAPSLKAILYTITNIVASPISLVVNGLTMVKDVIWLVAAGFEKSSAAIGAYIQDTYARVGAIGQAISAYFNEVGSSATNAARLIWQAMDGVGRSIALIYKSIYTSVRSTFIAIGDLARWVGSAIAAGFQSPLASVKGALSYLVNLAKWSVGAIRGYYSGVGQMIGSAFNAAGNGAKAAFQYLVNSAAWTVNQVRSAFSSIGNTISNAFGPVLGVINQLRGAIGGLINSAQQAVSSIGRIPSLPRINIPGFTKGGVIGTGKGTQDDQLILAQRGEGILTHEAMAILGADRLALLNRGIPAFAEGGIVGKASPVKAGGFTLTLDASNLIDELRVTLASAIKTGVTQLKSALSGSTPLPTGVTRSAVTGQFQSTSSSTPVQSSQVAKAVQSGMAKAVAAGSTIDLNAVFKGSNWTPAGKSLQGPNESIFEAAGFSATLVRTIKAFEHFSGSTYKDSEGIDTIGFGSARTSGDPAVLAALKKGRVSVAEANVLMLNHLKKENPIAYIRSQFPNIKDFSEGQIAALVSIYYNGGPGIIKALAKKAQTIPQIAAAIPTHWINSGTPSEAGLRNRRAVESRLFNAVSSVSKTTANSVANSTANSILPTGGSLRSNPTGIPTSVKTYLTALSQGLTPKITPALAVELNKLAPGAVSQPGSQSLKVQGVGSNQTFVRATRTGQKDKNGLEIIRTDLIRNGQVIDSMFATSGQPNVQNFQVAGQRGQLGAGSMAPVPEGIYSIGKVDRTTGSFGAGLGNTYIPIEGNFGAGRSAIGFHRDANITVSPGSAGCVVFNNQADIDRMANWVTSSGAKTLVTDWGLGSIKTTGSGTGVLTPNPSVISGLVKSVIGTTNAVAGNVGSQLPSYSPGSIPNFSAGLPPGLTPGYSPGQIPDFTAGLAPGLTPDLAPGLIPGLTPDQIPELTNSIGDLKDTIAVSAEDLSGATDRIVGSDLPKIVRYGSLFKDGTVDRGGYLVPRLTPTPSPNVLPGLLPSLGSPNLSNPANLAANLSANLAISLADRGGSNRGGQNNPFVFRLDLNGGASGNTDRTRGNSGEGRTYEGIRSVVDQVETQLNDKAFQRQLVDRLIEALRGDDRLRSAIGG